MRLYHVPNTRSTRVLWLLEEIGAPYDLTLMTGDERRGEEHVSRHPLGRVPVIEDDEGFVFESLGDPPAHRRPSSRRGPDPSAW